MNDTVIKVSQMSGISFKKYNQYLAKDQIWRISCADLQGIVKHGAAKISIPIMNIVGKYHRSEGLSLSDSISGEPIMTFSTHQIKRLCLGNLAN